MNRVRTMLAALAVATWACAAGAAEEDAEKSFQSLYGAAFKKAMASPDRRDDEALIRKMTAAARDPSTPVPLAVLLCERSHDVGVLHRDGCEPLIDAMLALAERKPERKAECLDKIVNVFQRRYDAVTGPSKAPAGDAAIDALLVAADARCEAGDTGGALSLCTRARIIAKIIGSPKQAEIQAVADAAAARQAALGRVKALRAAMAAGTGDANFRREIVRLYVVELDDPATAAGFLNDSCDEAMRRYVPAVVKGLAQTPELACAELRDWYRDLAKSAPPLAKAQLLGRAVAYNQRFLELHGAADAQREQATEAGRLMAEELSRLRPERKLPTSLVAVVVDPPPPPRLDPTRQPADPVPTHPVMPPYYPGNPYPGRTFPGRTFRTYTP